MDRMRPTLCRPTGAKWNLLPLPASLMLDSSADRCMHWSHASNVMRSILGALVEYLAQGDHAAPSVFDVIAAAAAALLPAHYAYICVYSTSITLENRRLYGWRATCWTGVYKAIIKYLSI